MLLQRPISIFAALILIGVLTIPLAQAQSSLAARVDRIERLMSQQRLSELVLQIQQMQQELAELRGQVELQQYQLQELTKQTASAGLNPAKSGQVSRVSGDGVSSTTAGIGTGASVLPNETLISDTPAAATDPVAEEKAYRAAFELLKDRDYPAAKEAFESVLASFPEGRYSDNSLYWLGEIAYVTQNYSTAIGDFTSLIDRYPESSKRPGAMLKLGYLRDETGDPAGAREVLQRLIETYPNSTESRLAGARLERLN